MTSLGTNGEPWLPRAEETAHDVAQDCDVEVVVGPGVYATDKVWVRPLDGRSVGWLAPCRDLVPADGSRS